MLNDLWYLIMPSIPAERTLLYSSVLGLIGLIWVINLIVHKFILRCQLSYLLNIELFSTGVFGIWNIFCAFWAVASTQQNFATRLSQQYSFDKKDRYTASANIYTPLDRLSHFVRILLNVVIIVIIWQQAMFDSWRISGYTSLINAGIPSPYLSIQTPLQQVNLTFIASSHICVVALPDTIVLPIGRYAPFVWDKRGNETDLNLYTIEQNQPQHPAVSLTPVECVQNQCDVHIQIQPNETSIMVGYDNPAAVSQLEFLIDQWYVSAIPRHRYDALYYIEIRADGIYTTEPSPAIRTLCAK